MTGWLTAPIRTTRTTATRERSSPICTASRARTEYKESYLARIGGIDQWICVRGQDRDNPIILLVHGGPASPLIPTLWQFQRPLEEYFTVVNYDQRGGGRTHRANDPDSVAATIHIAQYVSDAIELAESIIPRYGARKLVLMGHSWGTVIALQAALARPELFHAYVGIGQIINTKTNEELSFTYGLEQARQTNNTEAIKEMETIAPYPGETPITREYTPEDVDAIDEGNEFTLGKVLDEFLEVDFTGVSRFPIPVLMFMGRHDYTTPSEPTAAWLEAVEAPYKRRVWFENSAHLVPFEEPGKTLLSLVEYVRPLTDPVSVGDTGAPD